jgi:hypothetical protein
MPKNQSLEEENSAKKKKGIHPKQTINGQCHAETGGMLELSRQ